MNYPAELEFFGGFGDNNSDDTVYVAFPDTGSVSMGGGESHPYFRFDVVLLTNRRDLLYAGPVLSKLGIWPMLGLQHSCCHSRENGNPETKNRHRGFPASSAGQALLEFIPMKIGAGMTNRKDTNLNARSLKLCRKFQKNSPFLPKMPSIRTAVMLGGNVFIYKESGFLAKATHS